MSAPMGRRWRVPRELLLVGAGAVPGALLRWWLQDPLVANLLGCLLFGLLMGPGAARPRLLLVGMVGFCGSLTTFSGWELQLQQALQHGRPWNLLALLGGTLAGGLGGLLLGMGLGRGLAALGRQALKALRAGIG